MRISTTMRIRKYLESLPTRIRLAASVLFRRNRLQWGMDPWFDIRTFLLGTGVGIDRRCVVFDVGANIGQTATAVRRWLPTVDLHCFEPSPTTFQRLQAARPKATLHECGMGRMAGVAKLDPGSFHTNAQVVPDGDESAEGLIEISTRTVDGELDRLGIGRLGVLKIDVEGEELAVLDGADAAIRDGRIELVLAEARIGASGDPKRHTPIERLLERLEPHGFRCAGFYIGAIAADRGVHHGDVLMVRADRLPAGMYWSPSDVLDGHPCPFKD